MRNRKTKQERGWFGRRLKEVRTERGLEQKELADRVGLERSTITAYETGKRSPKLANLRKLADSLGVTLDYLGGRAESPQADEPFPLPSYVAQLSPEMQAFLEREATANWPRLRLLRDAELRNLSPDQIEQVLNLLIEVKESETTGKPIPERVAEVQRAERSKEPERKSRKSGREPREEAATISPSSPPPAGDQRHLGR